MLDPELVQILLLKVDTLRKRGLLERYHHLNETPPPVSFWTESIPPLAGPCARLLKVWQREVWQRLGFAHVAWLLEEYPGCVVKLLETVKDDDERFEQLAAHLESPSGLRVDLGLDEARVREIIADQRKAKSDTTAKSSTTAQPMTASEDLAKSRGGPLPGQIER